MFVDVLYEHTQDLLEKSGVPRHKIIEAPGNQASEQHVTMGREENHILLSTDQQPQNRDVSEEVHAIRFNGILKQVGTPAG